MSENKVRHYFNTYTNDECFETADEFLFHLKGNAEAHAQTLEDKKVRTHKRAVMELIQKAKAAKEAAATEGGNGTEGDAVNTPKKVEESAPAEKVETPAPVEEAAPKAAPAKAEAAKPAKGNKKASK